jgi:hypothetical protein
MRLLYFILLTVSAVGAENFTIDREEWAMVLMQGQPAGYHHSLVKKFVTPAGVRYVTEKEEEIRLKRMGTILITKTRSKVTENERGVVLNFETTEKEGTGESLIRGFRVGEQMVVLVRGLEQRYDMPAAAAGPREAERLSRAMPLRPGEKMDLKVFLEEFPQAMVTMSAEVLQKEKKEWKGDTEELWKVAGRLSVLPGLTMNLWVNDEGETRRSVLPFPGLGEIEMISVSKEEALAGKTAPEIFLATMVRPDKPLRNHRKLQEARLRLSAVGKINLFSGPEQEVVSTTDQGTEIVIRVPHYQAQDITGILPLPLTPELQPYVKASPYIDSNREIIQQLAKQAVGSEKNPLLAAQKIEAFVREYIADKNLEVNFASASETARSRRGDCTEHGVLCAALGRAVGLPTRVVIGLGYLPTNYSGKEGSTTGEFGFHLWAEAWIGEGRWVAMDAALGQFDVGHIAIFKTALEEASPFLELTGPVLNLMDKMKIEVLETK